MSSVTTMSWITMASGLAVLRVTAIPKINIWAAVTANVDAKAEATVASQGLCRWTEDHQDNYEHQCRQTDSRLSHLYFSFHYRDFAPLILFSKRQQKALLRYFKSIIFLSTCQALNQVSAGFYIFNSEQQTLIFYKTDRNDIIKKYDVYFRAWKPGRKI